MNTICLVIDRLHAGYVGAYGNTWIDTPVLDRLAFDSFVADQLLIDSPHLETVYRSYWHGRHAMDDREPPDDRSALAELLAASGAATALVTDEPVVADHPSARGFIDRIEIPPPESAVVAQRYDQTQLAGSFARAIDWLDSVREPFLLWCHFAGLASIWDAPLELRRRYAEADDPEPPRGAGVPCRMLEEDYDPDELLGVCQSYAGQMTLLDTCVGAMLEFLDAHPAGRETLVVLTSPRGLPLGEHRRLGPCDDALYGELVHVPLFMRFPDGQGAAVRCHALTHPPDLWATLLDWSRMTDLPAAPAATSLMPLVRDEAESLRDRLCIVANDGQRAIRTSAWYLRQADGPELFAKPDDRWEVNNVADRCPDVVEGLIEAFDHYEQGLLTGRLDEVSPLDESVRTGPG